jgi:hypothetical protein
MKQADTSGGFRDWVRGRIDLAKRLDEGKCGGSYGDAMLILSALLSGQAADLWPGTGKDRQRFVEIWSTFSSPELNPNLISGPLLLADLEKKDGNPDLVKKVKDTNPEAFASWNDSLVVTGQRVDRTESHLAALDSRLTPKKLRRFSYGNVFYEHVRSGYTHEYHTTDSASPFRQANEPAPVSYVNVLRRSDRKTQRRIHFDVAWVAEVVASVCTSIVALDLKRAVPDPGAWWVDG